MRNGSPFPSRRGVAALGALVLVAASMAPMVVAGPGGVAWAASKSSKSPTPHAFAGPAASGKISYVSGNSLEVQNAETGQTTVDISSKTAITATVAVSLKAVASGSCITATGTKAKSGAIDATTITLVAASGGKCGVGGFRSGRGAATGGGNFRPRTTGSSGATRHFTVPANTATAFGKVTSVSGSTVSIEGTMFSFSAAGKSASSSKKSTSTTVPKATKVMVDVSSKTKYLKTGTGSAKSLKVGECATAFGSTSSIGAVTATRLSVTPATGGTCGFGGGFGGGGFSGPGGGAAGANG